MIFGKVNAQKHKYHVGNMQMGDTGFIEVANLVITQHAIFLDLFTQFVPQDNEGESNDSPKEEELQCIVGDFISIKKIGIGFTENDFELDFSNADEYELDLEGRGIYHDCMKDKDSFVVFTKFELGRNTPEQVDEETLEDLKIKLENASKKDDFELCIILKKKIKQIEDKEGNTTEPHS